jgi:hypothetical protein
VEPRRRGRPLKLGFAVLAPGAWGAGLAFVPRSAGSLQVIGSVGLAVILGFALPLYRSIDRAGGTAGGVIDAIGMGVVVALAGAVCLEVSK